MVEYLWLDFFLFLYGIPPFLEVLLYCTMLCCFLRSVFLAFGTTYLELHLYFLPLVRNGHDVGRACKHGKRDQGSVM